MDAKKYLSFDEFVDASAETLFADVPIGPDRVVRIASVTADEYVAWDEARNSGAKDARKEGTARLIAMSMVDADGQRIGLAATPAQIERIKKSPLGYTEPLLKAIFKLNGINQREDTATKNA